MLTDPDIARYREDGYVPPDWRMPMAQLDRVRAEADAMLERLPHYRDLHPALMEEGGFWPELAHDPALVGMVRKLIGDDLIVWSMGYFGKPALNGKAPPWHQDGEYWPIRPLATCTIWLALDDATVENGCLMVIPGSHKAGRLRRHHRNDAPDLTLNQEIDLAEYDPATAQPIELKAGQISLHDAFMIHGSEANSTPNRRRGVTLRYMPATSVFDRDLARRQHEEMGVVEHEFRRLYQVSGADASGRNTLVRERPVAAED